MKTNKSDGALPSRVFAGIAIELGRPVLGARFYDVEKVAMAVAKLGVEVRKIQSHDQPDGGSQDRQVQERRAQRERPFGHSRVLRQPGTAARALRDPEARGREIDTVFSLDLACRVQPGLDRAFRGLRRRRASGCLPTEKTNVGLGRPRVKEEGR